MNECAYKNYDELPLMLNVVQVAAVLGISRAGAYELVHSVDKAQGGVQRNRSFKQTFPILAD